MRIGSGFDVHAYGPGDSIVLGGVRIPHTRGVVAHSDGDVVLHALCDALLGAAGLGDIGMHFPDTDPVWKGADSRRFVAAVLEMLSVRRLKVGNADITLLAKSPKVSPYRLEIRRSLAQMLKSAGTIVWNGPVGVFEFDAFSAGTETLARAIAESKAFSIAGGGDTLAAIAKYGIEKDIGYISTGGGAFLEMLEGKTLPAIEILERRAQNPRGS